MGEQEEPMDVGAREAIETDSDETAAGQVQQGDRSPGKDQLAQLAGILIAERLGGATDPNDRPSVEVSVWENKFIVTVVAALIAASPPATIAVSQYFTNQRESETKQIELDQKYKLEYMKLLIGNYKDGIRRRTLLDFMAETAHSEDTREWARKESRILREEVESLKIEIRTREEENVKISSELQEAAREAEVLRGRVASLQTGGRERETKELIEARERADRLAKQLTENAKALRAAEEKLELASVSAASGIRGQVDQSRQPFVTSARCVVRDPDLPQELLQYGQIYPQLADLGSDYLARYGHFEGCAVDVLGREFGRVPGRIIPCTQNECFGGVLEVLNWSSKHVKVRLPERSISERWEGELILVTAEGIQSELFAVEGKSPD